MVERPLPPRGSGGTNSSRTCTITTWSGNCQTLACVDTKDDTNEPSRTYRDQYTAQLVNECLGFEQRRGSAIPWFSYSDTDRSYCGRDARLLRVWRCLEAEAQQYRPLRPINGQMVLLLVWPLKMSSSGKVTIYTKWALARGNDLHRGIKRTIGCLISLRGFARVSDGGG